MLVEAKNSSDVTVNNNGTHGELSFAAMAQNPDNLVPKPDVVKNFAVTTGAEPDKKLVEFLAESY